MQPAAAETAGVLEKATLYRVEHGYVCSFTMGEMIRIFLLEPPTRPRPREDHIPSNPKASVALIQKQKMKSSVEMV